LGRNEVARDAGMSKRQKDEAIRIARVPEDEFEAAVEAPDFHEIAISSGRRILPIAPDPA